MEYSKEVKTTFIFIFLMTISTNCYAAWDSNSRFQVRNLQSLENTTNASNTRRVLMNMETQLNASQYKAYKGFNQSATFNAPVPATTTGTLVRTVPIPKNSIGAVAKKLALGGARFGLYGLAFEAAVLGAGYVYDQYTEEERLNDPSIIEGDFKDISKFEEMENVVLGELEDYGGALPGLTKQQTADYRNETQPDRGYFSVCNPYPDSPDYSSVCVQDRTVVVETVQVPVEDEELYDSIVDSMTDEEFEDFLNDENVKPHVFDIPEVDSISDDTSNDFDTSTDFNPDGTPNQNTNPYTNDENDDNLDSLSVPDFDASELNNPDPQTNPDPNTDPNENPNNNYSPDSDSGNDPEPNYTLNYQGGHEWTVPDFYTQKYPEGLQKAWTDNEQNFDQTAIVTFLNSFVDGIPTTGSCPSWVVTFNLGVLGNYGSHDIAPDCNVFTIIKIILLVSTAFLMRSIIFGG